MLLKNGGLHTVKSICSSSKGRDLGWVRLDFFFLFSVVVLVLGEYFHSDAGSSFRNVPYADSSSTFTTAITTIVAVDLSSRIVTGTSDAPAAEQFVSSQLLPIDIGTKHVPLWMSRGEQQGKYRRRTCSNVHSAYVIFL